VGSTLNWYLHGVLTVQYILYLLHSRNDKTTMKIIVHLIFALDTVQTCFTMDDVFFWFVYGFGDVNRLFQFHWAFHIPTLDAIIGLIVQGVYCWRIWKLSGWRIIPIFILLVSLVAGASGFIAGIQFRLQHKAGTGVLAEIPSILWLVGSAVADITIAGSMTYVLLHRRSAPRVRRARGDKIIRLLALTLETNAVTAAVAIVTPIIFFAKSTGPPATNIFQIGGFLLGKLYSNCFMVLLNQRHHGPGSRNGTTTSSRRRDGLRSETSDFNIELGTISGARIGTVDLQSPQPIPTREPPTPKAQDLVNHDDYQGNVPLPEVKSDDPRFGYKEPSIF